MEAKCYRAMRRAQGKMLRVSSRHFHGQKYGTAKNASRCNRETLTADRSILTAEMLTQIVHHWISET